MQTQTQIRTFTASELLKGSKGGVYVSKPTQIPLAHGNTLHRVDTPDGSYIGYDKNKLVPMALFNGDNRL